MNQAQFLAHLKTIPKPSWVTGIVTHHTANPTEATWRQYGGWKYWGPNTASYYANRLGWKAGPHFFVSYESEGIGLMTPVSQKGIHAGATANATTIGGEIVGRFSTVLPTGATLDNAAFAFAALLWWAKLPISALKAHRQYLATECPGNKLWANWSWWQAQVGAKLQAIIKQEEKPPDPPDPPAPTEIQVLEAKVAAHGRLIVELEQANRDRMADIAAINQDLMSHGAILESHEQRLTTLEALVQQGAVQIADLASRLDAMTGDGK